MTNEKKKLEETAFYINGRRLLAEVIKQKRSVEDLGVHDVEYNYIRNSRVKDANGRLMTTEEKFTLLGYERKSRFSRDIRQELYDEISQYLAEGGSFHVERKTLPFYSKLRSYASQLRVNGKPASHEEIIRGDLGFSSYSDLYFRCVRLEEIKKYRDENGYVDSYRKDEEYATHLRDMAMTLNVPIHILITLIADEKLKESYINTDRISYLKYQLNEYLKKHGDLVGITSKSPELYEALRTVTGDFSDGSGVVYTRNEMLDVLGFGDVKNKLRPDILKPEDDDKFESTITHLKKTYGDKIIKYTDIEGPIYAVLQKRAVKLNITIYELCRSYGLNYRGNYNTQRLSKCLVKGVPYLEEMRAERDALIEEYLKDVKFDLSKEEMFELRVTAAQQVYEEFKPKYDNFTDSDVYYENEKNNAD